MALDGIFLHTLIKDLKENLINGKIDKINQPEKDEIILTVRKDRKNIKILLSSSSKFPRIHCTSIQKENPKQAPMFAMVLRKYLIGGKIINISQVEGDRIVIFTVEASDELGFNSMYSLIVEIMGRHSNITLVRNRDNKVMESIKHITPNINSFRVIYPGIEYIYPPKSNKVNPFDTSLESFLNFLEDKTFTLDKYIYYNSFTGVSKILSENLFSQFNPSSFEECYFSIENFIKSLDNILCFCTYSDNNYLKDFYCMELNILKEKYTIKEYDTPHTMMDVFFSLKDKQDRLFSRSYSLSKLIHNNIDRCKKKESKLNEVISDCTNKEIFKLKGDLLTSFIYSIKKGDSEVNLNNFYEEDNPLIKITLDENKTPSENIQFYYKKYSKSKKSEASAIEQLKKNSEELEYLYTVLTNLENCENYNEIEEIKKELIETGYLRYRRTSQKSKKEKTSKPLHFINSSGVDIYVGKNNLQNDYLSLKFAKKNYMWFHTKQIPGSHVIVASDSIDDKTFEDAGIIAGFYSKAKDSSKVEIDYTEVKNLKKPVGSKPGMVIYHTNYSMTVNPKDFNNLDLKRA